MKMFCKYFRKTNEIQNIYSPTTDTYTPKKLERSFPPIMWAHLLGDRKRMIRQGGRQSQVKGGETFKKKERRKFLFCLLSSFN